MSEPPSETACRACKCPGYKSSPTRGMSGTQMCTCGHAEGVHPARRATAPAGWPT
jgi:hypothetical protein